MQSHRAGQSEDLNSSQTDTQNAAFGTTTSLLLHQLCGHKLLENGMEGKDFRISNLTLRIILYP